MPIKFNVQFMIEKALLTSECILDHMSEEKI